MDENNALAHQVRGEAAARIEIPNAAPKTRKRWTGSRGI